MAGLALFLVAALAGLALAGTLSLSRLSERLLLASASGLALVVGTLTIAGAVGVLQGGPCAGILLASAAILVLLARRRGGAPLASIAEDLRAAMRALALLRAPEVGLLSAIAALGWIWAAAAAYWLPPRSVDDLAHHLTPVFEAAARGRFVLLPLDVHPWFAYPLAADLLSLWPALLSGSIRWSDGAQLVTGPIAALAAYAIARQSGASARAAAAAALLLGSFPVVARHASSAYTDISVAAFFGLAAAGAVGAALGGGAGARLLFGIGAGLLAGSKYHLLFAVVLLAPLALRGVRRAGSLVTAVLPALLLSGFWYVRNLVTLGNPVFPYSLAVGPWTLSPGALPPASGLAESSSFLGFAPAHPESLAPLFFGDIGAGGLDGGMGALFWGAMIPLAAAGTWLGARRALRAREATPFALPLAFLAGLAPYLASHAINYTFTVRFLLAAALPAAAFLALALDRIATDRLVLGVSRGGIVLVAALSLLPLGGDESFFERKQQMRVGAGVDARSRHLSPWRAAFESQYGVGRTAPAWDLLEVLSAPDDAPVIPLWIYSTGRYPAPLYGSRLVNRIWNSGDPERPPAPDALVYYLTSARSEDRIEYMGDRSYPLSAVAAEPDRFELALATPYLLVYLDRERFVAGREEGRRLASYYETALAPWIDVARSLDPPPQGGTIVAPDTVGFGLKALELRGALRARVVPARPSDVPALVDRFRREGPVYVVAPEGSLKAPVAARMTDGSNTLLLYAVGGGGS